MPKKPHAHIVCLALLMNQNMLQPFLIVICCIVWNAKFHVMLLQVHSVLVTTNMMQFYIRWFYQNMPVWHQFYDYDLFVMFQEREQYMLLFRLFFTVPISVTRLRDSMSKHCVIETQKILSSRPYVLVEMKELAIWSSF